MYVEDEETESLLLYLESRFGGNYVHKMRVLKLAQEWLELKVPGKLRKAGAEECRPALELSAHATPSTCL